MPKTAFLHKKSLLDTFKDDYRVTNPIKAARAERTWDNPIVRHKREREINKWAHSFAGKKHFRKLTRFNATREANESCRVLYPLEDVVKVVTDALRTVRTRIYQVDGYYQFIQDRLQYGMVVAKDIAHRDFPYRWEVQANLVTRLKKGNEIVMEYHPNTPEELSEYLQEEGAIEPNEAKMKISVRESKKNEKDEPTYVWFGLEQDEDGDFTDSIAVFVGDVHNGRVPVYSHIGQHAEADVNYVRGLYADPNPKGDLYKELIGQGYDNLVVVNTNVAEDMLGVGMFPDGDQRADEDPEQFDKYEARKEALVVTSDNRKSADKAFGLFVDQLAGYVYDGAYSDIDTELATDIIYDSLSNTYEATGDAIFARATVIIKAVATESADAERYSRELESLVSAGIDEVVGDLNGDLAELGQDITVRDQNAPRVQGNTWVKVLNPTWKQSIGVNEDM